MSKKAKRLVILLAVLVALGAVYGVVAVYNHKQQEKADREAEIAENGFLVKEMDKDQITGFSYQHPHDDEFSDTKYTFVKEGQKWYYKDDKDFPVSQTVLETKLEDLSKVYAKRLLEETDENFATYGLDDPDLLISVSDGRETVTYQIGHYNESTADYYMNIKGTEQVYTVDGTLPVAFGMELYDMVKTKKFPEIRTDQISRVNIKTPERELEFTFDVTDTKTDSETGRTINVGDWYIVNDQGERVKANQSKTSVLISAITGISYVQEVEYNCPEDKLKDYGLDAPAVVITIDYTEEKVDTATIEQRPVGENINEIHYETDTLEKHLTLSLGNTTDTFTFTDDYYAKTSEDNSVLTIEAAVAELFMELNSQDYIVPDKVELASESPARQ